MHESKESKAKRTASWLIITGGFHQLGGMDKANYALAHYLIARGDRVHLMAHHFDQSFSPSDKLKIYQVARPANSFLLGEMALQKQGYQLAQNLKAQDTNTRVIANGGNCWWPDINWVHSVHHAWPCTDQGAPLWFKLKNRATKWLAKYNESHALRDAQIVLANSISTRDNLLKYLSLKETRVHTIYLGSDQDYTLIAAAEREHARQELGIFDQRPLILFVGAMSYDQNKGFDTLWKAWQYLSKKHQWDGQLIVAGGGNSVGYWQEQVASRGLKDQVKLVGFSNRIKSLLAAADLLVSPVRYEAYGLNAQEALCRGIPVMISKVAGIAERYPTELQEMLLPDAEDDRDLAQRLLKWRNDIAQWQARFLPFSAELRGYTWRDMAHDIVSLIEKVKK